jgi:hypothetical protein
MSWRRPELDFAGQWPRHPPLGWALLIVGTLAAALATDRSVEVWTSRARYGTELARLEAEGTASGRKPPAARTPADPRATARAAASRQLTQSLQRPWADLLDVIEVKPADDVALLSVEPSALKRTVRITAEARNTKAMLKHLDMLQSDSRLNMVTLMSHQRQAQLPGAPWRYQIQGTW